MEDKKKPKVRFQGFGDEWENKYIGELADIVRGASPRPIQDLKWFDETSEVGWLRISDVTEQEGKIFYLEQRLSKLGQEKTRVVIEPHLLLSIAASVGKPVINYVSTGVHDGFLIFQKPLFNQNFMYQWLKMFEEQWQKYGQPGSQLNLNSEIVKRQNIYVPNKQEQQKIGSLFSNIDNLINEKQKKYDKLVNIKKSMLEKMFPKNGSKYPEVRFQGFSDEWVEYKVGDITDSYSGGTPSVSNKSFYGGNIPFIRSGEINEYTTELFINDIGLLNSSAKLVEKGDILYALYGATSGEVGISKINGAINQAILAIKPKDKHNVDFIAQWFRKEKNNIVSTYLQGGQGNLSGGIIKELIILSPRDFKEQQKIGAYFQNLVNLITQQQKQLEKLKTIKKSLLENMFV